MAPGGSWLNREGLRALKEELKAVAIAYPHFREGQTEALTENRASLAPQHLPAPCSLHSRQAVNYILSLLSQHAMAVLPSIPMLRTEAAEYNLYTLVKMNFPSFVSIHP